MTEKNHEIFEKLYYYILLTMHSSIHSKYLKLQLFIRNLQLILTFIGLNYWI